MEKESLELMLVSTLSVCFVEGGSSFAVGSVSCRYLEEERSFYCEGKNVSLI